MAEEVDPEGVAEEVDPEGVTDKIGAPEGRCNELEALLNVKEDRCKDLEAMLKVTSDELQQRIDESREQRINAAFDFFDLDGRLRFHLD